MPVDVAAAAAVADAVVDFESDVVAVAVAAVVAAAAAVAAATSAVDDYCCDYDDSVGLSTSRISVCRGRALVDTVPPRLSDDSARTADSDWWSRDRGVAAAACCGSFARSRGSSAFVVFASVARPSHTQSTQFIIFMVEILKTIISLCKKKNSNSIIKKIRETRILLLFSHFSKRIVCRFF